MEFMYSADPGSKIEITLGDEVYQGWLVNAEHSGTPDGWTFRFRSQIEVFVPCEKMNDGQHFSYRVLVPAPKPPKVGDTIKDIEAENLPVGTFLKGPGNGYHWVVLRDDGVKKFVGVTNARYKHTRLAAWYTIIYIPTEEIRYNGN